jgi:hypothetical protein
MGAGANRNCVAQSARMVLHQALGVSSMPGCTRAALVMAAIVAMTASTPVDAQWVMLAKRAVGRVQSMSQTSQDGATVFDTAAVIVDVPLEKVYATVRVSLGKATTTQGITITREDDAAHVVQFSRGDQSATIQVVSLGDKLTHIMVSSVQPAFKGADAGGTSATPGIVGRILMVCKEMNVHCSSGAP